MQTHEGVNIVKRKLNFHKYRILLLAKTLFIFIAIAIADEMCRVRKWNLSNGAFFKDFTTFEQNE